MVGVVIKWESIGRKVIAKKEKLENKLRKRKCYRKYEYAQLPSYQKLQSSGRMRLESFERAMRYYFAHSKMKLGYMQKRLVDVYTIAALRKFFQADLVSNLKFLSRKYLIEELNDAVAILFPRYILLYNDYYLFIDEVVKQRDLHGLLQ
jgi:hypothetical protein